MQADKSVLCAQAVGADPRTLKETARTVMDKDFKR
jgi:hypothetical protein